MGSKSSIGIGGLIFWTFIIFQIFDDDDEDTKPVEVDTEVEVEISEQVKEKANEALSKAREMIDDAKKKLDDEYGDEENEDETDMGITERTGNYEVSQESVDHLTEEEEIDPEPEVNEEPKKKERFKPI